ncbi:fumarylacetoacetate hydrolase family protein [Sulfuricaulis sp.]|jgi:2-keto-4-pentenoate hydratase/2-oxohepta-3-ene-1,7-dioic acid hydratase in catechol pathway|uniref:fumarylacetoacetate hydrolase family protein n=1 Tax=Sulfuricaulis sp. TaxID=2003553 RepID=UPI00355A9F9D
MHWIRFDRGGQIGFGTLRDGVIQIHEGDMFAGPRATNATVPLADVTLLTPCVPTKMIALWNNFNALAAKLNLTAPSEPLYLLKAPNSFLAGGQIIRVPASYPGKVVYEGELGIVIGKRAANVSESEAAQYIFGYTCSNDVTAAEIIQKDPTFAQWTRAKSFDTFGVFGPVIATDVNPLDLRVKTLLDGKERQNYPVSDMIFKPAQIVSLLSRDMTLYPGDVISCGTSVGVGSMKPGNRVEIVIDGIGTLSNEYK